MKDLFKCNKCRKKQIYVKNYHHKQIISLRCALVETSFNLKNKRKSGQNDLFKQISWELSEELNILHGSVKSILTENLQMLTEWVHNLCHTSLLIQKFLAKKNGSCLSISALLSGFSTMWTLTLPKNICT